ncbi:hypothetical protein ACFQ3P_43625, partial [Paraburkholderia sabiae]
ATLLAHQAHCALSDFRGKLRYLLVHGSILSRVGASTKSGAVHLVGSAVPLSNGRSMGGNALLCASQKNLLWSK